jgi:hypothetical protein
MLVHYVYMALIGWGGTLWWWGPHGPYGPRKPQPDPWKIFGGLVGAAGGIGAGIVLDPILHGEGLVALAVSSFFGGAFASSAVFALTGLGGQRSYD